MNPVARYALNLALAIDRTANAIAGGSSMETISARLGRVKEEHGGKIPKYRLLARFLVWGLDKIDKDHCEEAHEAETHEPEVIHRESVFDVPMIDHGRDCANAWTADMGKQ